jgi:hypothetical protein
LGLSNPPALAGGVLVCPEENAGQLEIDGESAWESSLFFTVYPFPFTL